MDEPERPKKMGLELLAVTMPRDEAAEIREEARVRSWPITMVLRERLKDGKRWREAQQKGAAR